MKEAKEWIVSRKHKLFPILYALIGVLAIVCYVPARSRMVVQDAWVWVVKSNVTLNFIIFLFLWGIIADKYTKGMSKKKSWAIWGVGFMVIILAFRFMGGMETIFG